MKYYSYPEFRHDVKTLIHSFGHYKPDALITITRGGLTLTHFLSQHFNIRTIFSINSISYDDTQHLEGVTIGAIPLLHDVKHVLIVDEIIDSGASMAKILEVLSFTYPDITFKSAVLFQKEGATVQADFYVHEALEWINFFWEEDSK